MLMKDLEANIFYCCFNQMYRAAFENEADSQSVHDT